MEKINFKLYDDFNAPTFNFSTEIQDCWKRNPLGLNFNLCNKPFKLVFCYTLKIRENKVLFLENKISFLVDEIDLINKNTDEELIFYASNIAKSINYCFENVDSLIVVPSVETIIYHFKRNDLFNLLKF